MTKRILITDPIDEEGIKILKKYFDVDVKTELKEDEIVKIIKNYDALIVRSATKVTKKIIDASNLKVIGRAGTGLDNIDVESAKAKGIAVLNSPIGNVVSVAELVFGMMISLSRNLIKANISMKSGKWEKKGLMGNELYGKTLGIIGLGRIGKEVAKIALAFGMHVIAYDPFIKEVENVKLVSLDELLENSDFITIHVPLTDETKNLIGKNEIEKMKKGVKIINTSRGGIVNEDALYDALVSGKIAGAALDVFENEPPFGSNSEKLLELDNVIVTPHIGASTHEAQKKCGIEIAENILKFFGNK